ncbi:MAG: hypothetical protein ACR2GT_00780 [Gaiellaceae bacterium]
MNPQFRKVALIAASLGLLLSLFLALRPEDDETAAPTTTATPTTTTATTTAPQTTDDDTTASATTAEPPPATTAPTPPGPPALVRIQLEVRSGAEPGLVRRFSVKQGRQVAIVVQSELSDHIHLHGYDLMADVAPGAPGTIRFTADVPGRFELELEDRGLQIADLEVRP